MRRIIAEDPEWYVADTCIDILQAVHLLYTNGIIVGLHYPFSAQEAWSNVSLLSY